MRKEPDRLLLRPDEAAVALGISRSRVYELVAEGAIPAIRLGGSIRIPVLQLQQWVASQLAEQSAQR
jgi:excisionase family DNA binding protein